MDACIRRPQGGKQQHRGSGEDLVHEMTVEMAKVGPREIRDKNRGEIREEEDKQARKREREKEEMEEKKEENKRNDR